MLYKVLKNGSLIDVLATFFPDSSKRTLNTWIKVGRILIGTKKARRGDQEVAAGVSIQVQPATMSTHRGLKILYSDRSMIAIDKPTGLLSVPQELPGLTSALCELRKHFNTENIHAVHRIDRETSGVLLFARGIQAREALKELFAAHTITRQYIALVGGVVEQNEGTWESRLIELPNFIVKETHDPQEGRHAITHYKVLERYEERTLLELNLETGRKHQIRVHAANAGHPVVGDERYYGYPARRLYLHAKILTFIHPFTKKKMQFSSPVPKLFYRLPI
ncbi:MAG: RluA family pseudouridine synthase [Parachlamydiales bacterium]|nr:RluA family pseudouridine synthase [Parachlamydiales bacterium]